MKEVSENLSWALIKVMNLSECTKDCGKSLIQVFQGSLESQNCNFIGKSTCGLKIECSMAEEACGRFGEHIHLRVRDQ